MKKNVNTILLTILIVIMGYIAVTITKHTIVKEKNSFLYMSETSVLPSDKKIDFPDMESRYFTKTSEYYDGNTPEMSNYICKNTGAVPQISPSFFIEQYECPANGIVGCGGTFTRHAIICGNQYFIEQINGDAGPETYGPFLK